MSFNDEILNILDSQKLINILESDDNSFENFQDSKKEYTKYLIEHIKNVQNAYEYIKENTPSILDDLEIPIDEMDSLIKNHDKSKWLYDEFNPYANHFYGPNKNSSEPDQDFDNAWVLHYSRNPHHPEYWNKKEMPISEIIEMLCDLWSFSWKKGDPEEIFEYYNEHKQELTDKMHPNSLIEFEYRLKKLKENFDEKYSAITGENLFHMIGTFHEAALLDTRKIIDIEKFRKIENLIKHSEKICIVRHISPDADAIGSSSALANCIKEKYPRKTVILADENKDVDLSNDDLLIILDLGVESRIATKTLLGNPKKVRIDHHKTGMTADICIEMPEAGSTAELVTLFLTENKYNISRRDAELLFKGIIADTGRLQYSLSPTTLSAMTILSSMGVDYKAIYNKMYVKDELSLRSKAYILSNYKTTENGVAYLYIDQERAKNALINADSAANQVSELGEIKGSPIWVVLNNRNGNIFMKIRSRTIPINKIAEEFGGGGHPNAAGLVVKSKEAAKDVLRRLDTYLKEMKEKNTKLI